MLIPLYAVFIELLSFVYTKIYRMTRKVDHEMPPRCFVIKLLSGFFLDCLLLSVHSRMLKAPGMPVWALLLLIADTDILIKKIPSELLLIAAAGCLTGLSYSVDLFPVAAAALFFLIAGLLFNQKAGIARYDVVLLAMLAIRCPDVTVILKFVSLFLILWGAAALCFRTADRSGRIRSIPLSPLILAAYSAAFMISLP